MENQENNNMSELDQLKAQYETLKLQFDQQEIVNDRLMKSSIRHSIDFYKRYRWLQVILYPLAAILGLLIVKEYLGNSLSIRMFVVSFCLTCLIIELWMTRKIRYKVLENNDLLNLVYYARSFKKIFSVFTILNYSTGLILTFGIFLALLGKTISLPNMTALPIAIGFIIVAFVSIGIAEVRYKTRPCNEIIRQIEASDETPDKKSDFDKKQKWFYIAMIVVFIGFDIWAYTIVGSYLKLPPMWQTKEYVRAADDFTSEGTLEFWEVYADTLVAEEDVPVVMENWQHGDSLVVMRSNGQLDLTETQQGTSRLYALKKTTPEGPAISSAVLHGKPMVAYVSFTYPRSFPDTEPVPMYVFLTSEARQLWYRFTTEIAGHRTAIVMDGVVIQDWQVMCGIENGKFMITRAWSSKDEVEEFCERLIRQ